MRSGRTAGVTAVAVLLVGTMPAPASPARAQEPGDEGGTASYPPGFETGVYEPELRIGQSVRVAVRILAVERVHGRTSGRRTVVRVRFRLDNPTREDLSLERDGLYLDWARRDRTPEQVRLEPVRIDGEPTLAPNGSGRVDVTFALRGDVDPAAVDTVRVQFGIHSDLGTLVLERAVFERDHFAPNDRFLFVPAYDPFSRRGVRVGAE